MMRRSTLLLLAATLGSACTHAPALTPSAPLAPTAPTLGEADDPPPPPELPAGIAADPNTIVVVIEAEDLGGGLDVIVAAPKRPALPSMMTDVAMAPSH